MSIVNNTDTVSQTQEFTKCDAELMVHQDDFLKDSELSKENSKDQGGQLVRTYGRKGHFGMFSKIYRHLRLIKNDVTTMKKILCSVECVVDKEDKSRFSFRFGDIRSWFAECDLKKEKVLIRTESIKFMEARIRAINFCKFHRLLKVTKTKKKKVKRIL
ncbi:unnamed protein product [Callosobruchus maculatus]|uniref:Uncharacterized protein n=1 Tax=Callosobruchus maculatus TaxID=64391 RepID=A0A653CG15_CALMS|nr:unnamed protein product [Callosobruchus maculatus]